MTFGGLKMTKQELALEIIDRLKKNTRMQTVL